MSGFGGSSPLPFRDENGVSLFVLFVRAIAAKHSVKWRGSAAMDGSPFTFTSQRDRIYAFHTILTPKRVESTDGSASHPYQ